MTVLGSFLRERPCFPGARSSRWRSIWTLEWKWTKIIAFRNTYDENKVVWSCQRPHGFSLNMDKKTFQISKNKFEFFTSEQNRLWKCEILILGKYKFSFRLRSCPESVSDNNFVQKLVADCKWTFWTEQNKAFYSTYVAKLSRSSRSRSKSLLYAIVKPSIMLLNLSDDSSSSQQIFKPLHL